MKLRLALPTLAFAALAALPAFADTWCNTFFGDDGPKNSLLASSSTDGKSVSVSLTDLTTGWKVGNVYYLKTGSDVIYVPSYLFDTGKANGNIAECTPTPSPSKDGVLSISYDSSTAKKYAQIAVRYIPWTYSIAFAKNATDAQGTAMTTMSGLSYTNTTTTLTANAYTRTGYSFGGWTTDAANAGTVFANQTTVGGEKFGVTSDGQTITLYAKWNANGYKISYNENGGTLGSSAPTSATYDTPFLVSAPTKTGYSFTGWTVSGSGFNKDTAKSGSSETSCSTSISDGKVSTKGDVYLKNLASTANAAVTLTAQWTAIKTKVTFSREGGTGGTGSIDSIAYGTSKDGYATIESPTKVGATFQGYYTATNGGGTQYFDKDGHLLRDWDITKTEVTLYARWSADTYTVKFKANGGSGTITSKNVTYSETFTLPAGNALTPSAAYYSFAGWSLNASGAVDFAADATTSVEANKSYATSGTLTFYAVWQDNQKSVSVEAGNDGTASTKSITVIPGQAYGTLPTVTPKSYKKAFAGWFTEATDGDQISETDTVPTPAPSAIYAHWTNTWYTIRFNGNDNTSGTMADQAVEFNVATNLSANAFQRTGYTFLGWAKTADAAKVDYANDASVTDLASAANATVDLYVVWTANVYTVTFDANGGEGTMPTLTNSYDVAFALPENVFTRPAADFVKFDHWLDEATGQTYADGATVSNLTATADGTVTLKAVWASTLSDLSAAMHCTSLNWENYNSNLAWEKHEGTNVGYGSNSCARPASDGTGQCMVTEIAGETSGSDDSVLAFVKGTLSFWWKPASAEAQIQIGLSDQMTKTPTSANLTVIQAQGTDWTNVQFRIDYESPTTKKCAVFVINDSVASDGNYNCVDQMTWTAGEAEDEHPEPTEADAVTISGLTATETGFTLTYTGDEKFAYCVLYTDSLASPITWLPYGSLTNDTGTSSSQTFELLRDASVPMRFFKVETIRRP